MGEYVKIIDGFCDYSIDMCGSVYSYKSNKFLKPYLTGRKGNTYLTVKLYKDDKIFNKKIHRLLLETFVGKCPKGMEACHNNGNRLDNKLKNLRWDTLSSNRKDSIWHGTANCTKGGENSPHHKLTEQDVRMIIYIYRTREFTQQEIADMYNLYQSDVSKIVLKKSWKCIWRKD